METLRYPTLAAWAKDMGDAIRERDGTTDPISHQDMPDRVRAIPAGGSDVDLSQIQTKSENVLETETYMGADGEMHYGTMPEIADETITLDRTNTFHTMEKGHHGGGGVVRIVPDNTGNTFTPSKNRGTYDAPAGMVYTRIILEPIPDIYVDPTDASATAADVLSTATFYGKSGTKETGGIATKTGKQGSNVVSNGNKYIPVGYHDGTSYFNVNVSQTIVDGEDSTNCTAEASDVRYGKSFRSGGSQKTGTLRTVSIPALSMEVDTSKDSQVEIMAYTGMTTSEGILPAGSSTGTKLKTIPKYTGDTSVTPGTSRKTLYTAGKYVDDDIVVEKMDMETYSGPYSVKPGAAGQTLYTAGKYLSSNIFIEARDTSGLPAVLIKNVDCSSRTEQLNITGVPSDWESVYAVIVSRQTTSVYGSSTSVVQDMYWEDSDSDGSSEYFSFTKLKGGAQDSSSYLEGATGYRDLKESDQIEYSNSGSTIQINAKSGWFYGVYRVIVIGIQ
jgi:hypothetical protein